MDASVIEILIADKAGQDLFSIPKASLIAGKGIIGDRYYKSQGTFSKKLDKSGSSHVTLIESEEIDYFNKNVGQSFPYSKFRRNIVTKGIKLNNLVGKEFYVGSVKLIGIELCEPCGYLSGLLVPEVLKLMSEGAGIRAQIISGGEITNYDIIGIEAYNGE